MKIFNSSKLLLIAALAVANPLCAVKRPHDGEAPDSKKHKIDQAQQDPIEEARVLQRQRYQQHKQEEEANEREASFKKQREVERINLQFEPLIKAFETARNKLTQAQEFSETLPAMSALSSLLHQHEQLLKNNHQQEHVQVQIDNLKKIFPELIAIFFENNELVTEITNKAHQKLLPFLEKLVHQCTQILGLEKIPLEIIMNTADDEAYAQAVEQGEDDEQVQAQELSVEPLPIAAPAGNAPLPVKVDEVTDARTVSLVTSDEQEIVIPYKLATLSITLQHMLQDSAENQSIPVPNISSTTIQNLIPYLKIIQKYATRSVTLGQPEVALISQKLSENELIELINAANFLDIPVLLKTAVEVLACKLAGLPLEKCLVLIAQIPEDLQHQIAKQITRVIAPQKLSKPCYKTTTKHIKAHEFGENKCGDFPRWYHMRPDGTLFRMRSDGLWNENTESKLDLKGLPSDLKKNGDSEDYVFNFVCDNDVQVIGSYDQATGQLSIWNLDSCELINNINVGNDVSIYSGWFGHYHGPCILLDQTATRFICFKKSTYTAYTPEGQKTFKLPVEISTKFTDNPVMASSDLAIIALQSSNQIIVVKTMSGEVIRTFPKDYDQDATLSRDGTQLALSGKNAEVFDIQSGNSLSVFNQEKSMQINHPLSNSRYYIDAGIILGRFRCIDILLQASDFYDLGHDKLMQNSLVRFKEYFDPKDLMVGPDGLVIAYLKDSWKRDQSGQRILGQDGLLLTTLVRYNLTLEEILKKLHGQSKK